MSNKDFYRAFEDKHRGSRELIKNRASIYLPFVLPLKKIYPDITSLDIGCGRGEWLELLRDNTISAQGIDLDEGMLKVCHKLNLDALQGNGVLYLKEQPDESMGVISAFHVVEHISFEDLQELVQESMRVLKPGGILILETPNPENIKVSSENFYLDPTHIKPIPSALLSFLSEFYGFSRTKVLRLQESKELANQESVNLLQVIEGASPDYAIVAQKEANEEVLKQFDEVFEKDFGLPLNSLADKFENRLVAIEAKATQAEAKATQAEANYYTLLNSSSWKITKPYRVLGDKYKWFRGNAKAWLTFAPTSSPRKTLKKALLSLKDHINANPKLKMKVISILNRFPKLKARLKRVGKENSPIPTTIIPIDGPVQLSPRAKKIYNDLKKAIDLKRG